MKSKPILIAALALILLVAFFIFKKSGPKPTDSALKPTKAPAPVNLIPIEQRPYAELVPLAARNELNLTIGPLTLEADSVEVALEYDRNKGVLDAVLKQFPLSSFPATNPLFMGTKSAGGHITYHDDVIGGKLTLTFDGGEKRYALEVPWRYEDTQTEYRNLSTADGKFQVELSKPWKTTKVVVMQSPGLPQALSGQVLAGPYLVRGLNPWPIEPATIKIRLSEDIPTAALYGFDANAWQPIDSTVVEKTLTATAPLSSYLVVLDK